MYRTGSTTLLSQPRASLTVSAPTNEQNNFFPDLHEYSDPRTGLLSSLPRSWIPYAQPIRVDRPAGLYAFYIPYLIGTTYAACISDPTPLSSDVVGFAALLLPLNIILRGVACAWNDNIDQDFDRILKRCRHRPIARGAVSTMHGHLSTIGLALIGCPFLALMPHLCTIHMAGMVLIFVFYALAKRITYYPRVILGFPFAWAIFYCIAAFGVDPFENKLPSTAALFTANVLWTIVYDTIYAHQDVEEDGLAGRERNGGTLPQQYEAASYASCDHTGAPPCIRRNSASSFLSRRVKTIGSICIKS